MNTIFPGKILVTTDFSEASCAAFPYALEQAKNSHSTITLVNAVDSPPVVVAYEYLPSPEEIDALKKETKLEAEKKLKIISGDYFAEVKNAQVVLEGVGWSADIICDYASKEKFGLIVIATQGQGFMRRLFLGSVAERILRQAVCPVLTVPALAEGPAPAEGHKLPAAHLPYQKIVVTTDFSEASRAALSIALHEARRTKAKLILAYVMENQYAPELLQSKIFSSRQVEQLQASYVQALEKRLREYAATFEGAPISCHLINKTYSVSNSIAQYLKNEGADLLVISPRGAGNRLNVLGGVIERTLRQSPCPVLVVPPWSPDESGKV